MQQMLKLYCTKTFVLYTTGLFPDTRKKSSNFKVTTLKPDISTTALVAYSYVIMSNLWENDLIYLHMVKPYDSIKRLSSRGSRYHCSSLVIIDDIEMPDSAYCDIFCYKRLVPFIIAFRNPQKNYMLFIVRNQSSCSTFFWDS